MKRQGSILIFVMFAFVFIASIGLYGLYMAGEQVMIANNTIAKIQSQYLAESKINKFFYDDYYYESQILPAIMENRGSINFKLDKSDLLMDDTSNIIGKFYNHEGERYIELSTTSEYRGIKSNIKAYGPIFNQIFYDTDGSGVLAYNSVKENHLDKFHGFINGLDEIKAEPSGKIRYIEVNGYENIMIRKSDKYEILGIEEDGQETLINDFKVDGFSSETVFLSIKSDGFDRVSLETEGPISLKGIVYFEGDLLITDSFELIGILISRGDGNQVITSYDFNKKPNINGALIFEGNFDIEGLDVKYDINVLNMFGRYLPNYIDPSLTVFKFN